jgi:hypothetical protein
MRILRAACALIALTAPINLIAQDDEPPPPVEHDDPPPMDDPVVTEAPIRDEVPPTEMEREPLEGPSDSSDVTEFSE